METQGDVQNYRVIQTPDTPILRRKTGESLGLIDSDFMKYN